MEGASAAERRRYRRGYGMPERGHVPSTQKDGPMFYRKPPPTKVSQSLEYGVWRRSVEEAESGVIAHIWEPITPHPKAVGTPLYLNGCIYYIMSGKDTAPPSVLSLDVATHEWAEHTPEGEGPTDCSTCFTMHGCLCVLSCSEKEDTMCMHIWMLDVSDGYRWHCAIAAEMGSSDGGAPILFSDSTRTVSPGHKEGSVVVNCYCDLYVIPYLLDESLRLSNLEGDTLGGDVSVGGCHLRGLQYRKHPLVMQDRVTGRWVRPDNVPDDMPFHLLALGPYDVLACGEHDYPYLIDLREWLSGGCVDSAAEIMAESYFVNGRAD
ncbi:hypothetical protein KIPB_004371 [Kipferlia bialata]|uniref:F-box associated domain-containing protein n=1 Tax=Kipferlia bialata TaxID=797122 RepID=A0A391NVT3_9EUKA|nr:hypothetical protein KIPB_004371 [Kipferlia bialata]|eukprot:g4371.t1